MVKLTDYVLGELESGKFEITVFMDLRKAFDTLYHEILLNKLRHCGIRDTGSDWLHSCSCNREQFICLNQIGSGVIKLK